MSLINTRVKKQKAADKSRYVYRAEIGRFSGTLQIACEQCEMVLKAVPAPRNKHQHDLVVFPFDKKARTDAKRISKSWEITERRAV